MWCKNGNYFVLTPPSGNALALSINYFALHKFISVKSALHSAQAHAILKTLLKSTTFETAIILPAPSK